MSKSRTSTPVGKSGAAVAGGVARMRRSPTHPGEIFQTECLDHADPPVSQAEAARRLEWSLNRMNEVVRGKRGVTSQAHS